MDDVPTISPVSACNLTRFSGMLMDAILPARAETDSVAPRTNCRLPEPSHTTRWPGALQLHAHSISTSAWDVLRSATGVAQVLGHFRRAVDLLIGDEVIALVLPEAGNGPFNVVVSTLPDTPLLRHINLTWASNMLHVGPWQIDFDAETLWWNPRPLWETLTLHPARLAQLRDIAIHEAATRAPIGSPFVGLLTGQPFPLVTALGCALAANNAVAIRDAAAAIAGLGPGLTPSGDDFLAGVMLGMQMADGKWQIANNELRITNHASRITHHGSCFLHLASCIFAAAAPRTTRLSQAFLQATSQGLADEHWHHLLAALSAGDPAQLEHAAMHVLDHGASSGLDMVAGFLWQLKAL
ncbi:MAG: DUF2877 domain-containing protein [Anaerolineae bacterium]|nr:DUF2877 domain-containing protein [Anaerolineae bacterium]